MTDIQSQISEALRRSLSALAALIEHQSASMRCSILLLDSDGTTLRHGAAPRLPQEYCDAIDGLQIGPAVGSCGTAAFYRRTTIVSDIANDELWKDFRAVALPVGLRACWSTPILASNGDCLGTFAMYYDEPRSPEPADLDIITTAGKLASAVIEREWLLEDSEADRLALIESNARLENQQAELEVANQQLQDTMLELEMLNQQLQENATELEMQTDELERARAEAEEANRAKTDFLATMSHELRTPLNAIGGYADLLLQGIRGDLMAEQRSDVERIKRAGQHLLGLINDILNFAKLESGSVHFQLADQPIAPTIQAIEALVRPQVDAKALTFAHRLPAAEVLVRADEEKVTQILLNLVTNAVKFTDDGGLVAIDCDVTETAVRVTVRDTGRGIPPNQLDRIFDPFVQIDREHTPKSQQGVGLGLAISRDLAVGMGGSLQVASVLGQGSSFTLTLPRAQQAHVSSINTIEADLLAASLLATSDQPPQLQ